MRNYNHFLKMFCISAAVVGFSFALCASLAAENKRRGIVECANLIYAKNKSSVCFSPEFLKQIEKETNISTSSKFSKVNMESVELYQYPFSVMTGEGDFSLSEIQRSNLRTYLMNG